MGVKLEDPDCSINGKGEISLSPILTIPVDLEEEAKFNLLEIIRDVFPEYDEVTFNLIADFAGKQEFVCLFKDKEITHIHWHEFCFRHLMPRIFETYAVDSGGEEDYEEWIIDFLPELLYEGNIAKTIATAYNDLRDFFTECEGERNYAKQFEGSEEDEDEDDDVRDPRLWNGDLDFGYTGDMAND